MVAERSSSAGVKSLRAMFENNTATDPSLRGRSPGGTSGQNGTDRPLSKVKTAFVEVGPSIKTTDSKTVDSLAGRQQSEGRSEPAANTRTGEETTAGAPGTGSRSTQQSSKAAATNPTTISNGPSSSGSIVRSTAGKLTSFDPEISSRTKDRGPKSTGGLDRIGAMQSTSDDQPSQPPADVLQNLANNLRTPSKAERKPPVPLVKQAAAAGTVENKVKATGSSSLRMNGAASSSKPTTLNPSKPRTTASATKVQSSHPKSPSITRPLPTRSRAAMEPFRRATSSGSTVSTAASSKPASSGVLSSTGFFKPHPRSPTRPIQLPAHLIAPTASSAAKHGNSPTPRASQPQSRRASVASRPSFGAPPPRTMSTIGPPPRSRAPSKASLAPSEVKPLSKVPEESFLARMMRPTASSASKIVQGKSEASSPKGKGKAVLTPRRGSFSPLTVARKRQSLLPGAASPTSGTPQREHVSQLVDSPREEGEAMLHAVTSTDEPAAFQTKTEQGVAADPVEDSTLHISTPEPIVPDLAPVPSSPEEKEALPSPILETPSKPPAPKKEIPIASLPNNTAAEPEIKVEVTAEAAPNVSDAVIEETHDLDHTPARSPMSKTTPMSFLASSLKKTDGLETETLERANLLEEERLDELD